MALLRFHAPQDAPRETEDAAALLGAHRYPPTTMALYARARGRERHARRGALVAYGLKSPLTGASQVRVGDVQR
jgi:hypothetical protein